MGQLTCAVTATNTYGSDEMPSAAVTVGGEEWTPADDSNLIYAIAPHAGLGEFYTEISSPSTPATAVDDPVGTAIDAISSLSISASATGRRPLLVQDGDGVLAMRFDGVDDCLFSTANLAVGGMDDVFAIIIARRISAAGDGVILETSVAWWNNVGTILALYFDTNINVFEASVGRAASTLMTRRHSDDLGTKGLIEQRYRVSESNRSDVLPTPSFNGSSMAHVADAQAASSDPSTFTSHPIFVGAGNNTVARANMDLYALLLREGMPDSTLLQQYRDWAVAEFGVDI